MNKHTFIGVIFGIASLSLLVISSTLEPISVLHSYYIMAAKHWNQGLIPWLGFDLKEMPLGIGLFNFITDIEANQLYARVLILFITLINTYLLWLFFRKNEVSRQTSLFGCILYLSMLSPFPRLGLSIEPFAVTFILLSYFGLISHQKEKNVFAGIMLVISIFFKFEVLFLIPCFTLLILCPTHRNQLHISRTFFFLLIITFFFLISYMGITIWSENMDWITYIDINPAYESHQISSWCLFFFNSGILGLILLQRTIPQKGMTKNLYRSACLGTIIFLLMMFWGCNKSSIQLILPINILALTMAIQKNADKKIVKLVYFISVIISITSSTTVIAFSPKADKQTPLLQTFNPDFQLQQEIKSPDYYEINTGIGAGIESAD